MGPLESLQATTAALTLFEKLKNIYKDWTGNLPEGPTKEQATKDLANVDENLDLARVELAKGLGYKLCQRHFPPGILLDIREDVFPRWKCSTCGDITPHKGPDAKPPQRNGESWVRRRGKAEYF